MSARRLTLVALSLGSLAPVACFRNLKADASRLKPPAKENLPAPTPPLPVSGSADPLPRPEVKPPKIVLEPGSVPPLPGMPGSQPGPASVPDSPSARLTAPSDISLTAGGDDADAQRRGILQRIRDRRLEKENRTLPELPPALEPKKEGVKPPASVTDAPAVKPKTGDITPAADSLKVARGLVDEAAKKFMATPDFESKLVKRETVGGRKQPTEEMRFLYRQDPFSVRLTVTGEAGRGREVLFVKGQNAGKLVIVTGEGDNRLIGSGKRIDLDPDSPLATNRTRGKIEDSGLGRPIRVLTKFVQEAEAGKRPADTIRSLGAVQRKEFTTPVDGVEVTLQAADDPLLPKGGRRQYYFDADPKSPSRHLPVLVITYEPNDAEVEYYCFTDFKLPAGLTDADFSADRLGRRR